MNVYGLPFEIRLLGVAGSREPEPWSFEAEGVPYPYTLKGLIL